MEEYIKNYDSLKKILVYNFPLGTGGIGDCVKFFAYMAEICIQKGIKICYLRHGIPLEKYILLKHEKMYITKDQIKESRIISHVDEISNLPQNIHNIILNTSIFYDNLNHNSSWAIKHLFSFSNEVKLNAERLLLNKVNSPYISIHLRLGDKYLETPKNYVQCPDDIRYYDERALFRFIENNIGNTKYAENNVEFSLKNIKRGKPIIFFCDNRDYKLKIKNKYRSVIITDCNIGHTSLSNTSEFQVLDSITEFYILSESETIYAASQSGFSEMAAKFKDIPLITI